MPSIDQFPELLRDLVHLTMIMRMKTSWSKMFRLTIRESSSRAAGIATFLRE